MFARILGVSKSDLDRTTYRLVLALVLSNVVWRSVRYGLGFPLFGDEAFVANSFLVRDFWSLSGGLEHFQIVPLLFVWANWVVTSLVGNSEWALRFVSYLAGIGSLFLFVRLAFKLLPLKTAVLAVAVFCASYFPVRHAAEVKPYATDLLVSLLVIYAFVVYLNAPNRRRWWGWVLVSVIGCWASYPSIFVSGGACAVLSVYALKKSRALLTPVVLGGALTLVSFGLMYWLVGSVQRSSSGDALINFEAWALSFPPFAEPSRWPQWFVHTHLGELFAYPIGGERGGSALTFILFCIGAWSLWQAEERLKVALLLSPFPLMFIAASMQAYPYGGNARVAQHVVPAICLLSGAGLVRLLRLSKDNTHIERRGLIFISLCLLLIAGGTVRDFVKPYKERGDLENRAVVSALISEAGADTSIVVFGGWGTEGSAAPDFYDWGGHAARMKYYFQRHSDLRILWGVGAEDVRHAPGNSVWVIAYHHPFLPFPEENFRRYLASYSDKLGPYEAQSYSFQFKHEKMVVYRFTPAGRPKT